MAKTLPYFKFDASEWISGSITLEDYEAQGVFINVCAYYWHRQGKLTLTEIKRRLLNSKPTAFDSLIKSKLIHVKNDVVKIDFLDEQLHERGLLCITNSVNGKKGGRPKAPKDAEKKPTALVSVKNNKAKKSNKEEEQEQEEEREEEKDLASTIPSTNIYSHFDKLQTDLLSEQSWIESVAMKNELNIDEVVCFIKKWILHLKTQGDDHVSMRNAKSWCSNWIAKQPKQPKSTQLTPEEMDATTLAVLKDWGLK